MDIRDLRIAVVAGGWSAEQPYNLRAGRSVLDTLLQADVDATLIEITSRRDFLPELVHANADFALLCVTEEVPIQGALEIIGVPYNGSGPLGTTLSLDKVRSRELMRAQGVRTPQDAVLDLDSSGATEAGALAAAMDKVGLTFPIVVKPRYGGCSLGVRVAKNKREAVRAVADARHYGPVIVESFIDGAEVTIGVVGEKLLTPIVIESPSDVYEAGIKWSHSAKYLPLSANDAVMESSEELVRRVGLAVGLTNAWRVDTILDDHGFCVLEANALPKLEAPRGEMAQAAAWSGMDHHELLEAIVMDAYASRAGLPDHARRGSGIQDARPPAQSSTSG